ncbi:MBL fold metallo-hydrolase [Ochrovirga pacifica]|uniref:MBL fold metallo-hydrolase n=1 Tax=Ochrovirga pacifica TaxID=1042376 RepID=UPI0002E41E07|nr:MBL fold metallo-hydrolase [Ochrovirga pacifica]
MLKKMMLTIAAIVVTILIAYILFTNYYPSFGGELSKDAINRYQKSEQFFEGKFFNTNKSVPKKLSLKENIQLMYTYFTTKVPNGRPDKGLKVESITSPFWNLQSTEAQMVWFGHSSFLLQIQDKTLLLDPMFGKVPAPHPWLGDSRFQEELPLALENLPEIDVVLFSHDHYDHLDYETILKIKDKTNRFVVPLGVGIHLQAWGVASQKITELDWWQHTTEENLKLICTPAQHFSGRKLNTSQTTLWSSWVIKSEKENIYFSGDSGYASHFKEIGNKYGPFDLALMECGQYNEMWADIHMMPEETAQAGVDVQAKKIMPIHWGSFKLALHDWKDPIIRVTAKAKELKLPVITPQVGHIIKVKGAKPSSENWWENL